MLRSLQWMHSPRALLVLPALWLSACGGSGETTGPPAVPTTGMLVITASGLPGGLTPTFTVTAADGSSRPALSGDTVRNLPAGAITIRPAQPGAPGIGRWVPFESTYTVTITAGSTATQTVQYAAASMVVLAATSGLPPGTQVTLRLTGPDGTAYPLTAGAPFLATAAGAWTIQGQPLSAGLFLWMPAGEPVTRSLLPGDTAAVTIPFTVASGAIEVATPGLDDGITPTFTATQGAMMRTRQGPGPFPDLPSGPWQITASAVSTPGTRYTPSVATQTVTVTLGALTTASVPFTSAPILANLLVEGAYLTQAVQTFDGSAPLVAGRDALLRVFLRASEPNDWRPMVRATLYDGATLLETIDIPAVGNSVDTTISEGLLARSWNVRIPGSRIVPALRVLIEADPERIITTDDDPSDNIWPRSGVPHPVPVAALSPWRVVLVPVTNAPTNLTGDVRVVNQHEFTTLATQLLPVGTATARVRAPYMASVATLTSNDGNGAWIALLNEINVLRAAEGVPGEYWYGVVRVNYSSGIAGYGFVPGRAAIGWDYLPSGSGVAAHEWGHNFSRPHAPCGNVANADPLYPHEGGGIGSWGWNSFTNQLVSPGATDLMGYCGNQWISAYNWTRAFAYRATTLNAIAQPAMNETATERLLVWGTITNGRVEVEPSFLLPGSSAAEAAPHGTEHFVHIDALDASGTVIATHVTAAPPIDHAPGDVRAFATTLPITATQHAMLASIRVRDVRSPLGGGIRRRSAAAAAVAAAEQGTPASLRLTRASATRVHVAWDTVRYPRALVRDGASGRILAMLREPADVDGASGAVEIVLSDGVRSVSSRLTP